MQQINARDWIFEVSEDPSAQTPTWAQVAGIESFTLSNSEGEETVDTTTFDSEGNAESQVMQRGAALTIEGRQLIDPDSGDQDPGQAAAEALAAEVGEASLGGFRFRHSSQDTWTVWTARVSLGDKGGAINEKTSWSATFTRSGAADTEAVA